VLETATAGYPNESLRYAVSGERHDDPVEISMARE